MLSGIYPVLPTPLQDDGAPDLAAWDPLMRFAATRGMNGVLVLGSNGESPYFMTDEKERIIAAACAAAPKTLPVMLGIISFGTDEAVALARLAERHGASSLLVALPTYYRLTVSDVKRHFAAVCKATSLPVLYYHFPACTGLRLTPEEVADVCSLEGIVGTKESVMNLREVKAHLRLIRKPGFAVFSGTTYLYPAVRAAGGAGVICPIPLLAPQHATALRDALARGDLPRARREHALLYETLPIMSGKFNVPIGVARLALEITSRLGIGLSAAGEMPHATIKEALRMQGVAIGTTVRSPLRPLDDVRRNAVHNLVRRLGEPTQEEAGV